MQRNLEAGRDLLAFPRVCVCVCAWVGVALHFWDFDLSAGIELSLLTCGTCGCIWCDIEGQEHVLDT